MRRHGLGRMRASIPPPEGRIGRALYQRYRIDLNRYTDILLKLTKRGRAGRLGRVGAFNERRRRRRVPARDAERHRIVKDGS